MYGLMYRSVYNSYRLLDQLYRYSSIMAIIPRTKGIRKILGQPQKVEKTPETTKEVEVLPEAQIVSEIPEKRINKKAEFRALKKLIKSGNFTTAIVTARALGIDSKTMSDWLRRKDVQQIAQATIEKQVKKIEDSKKWESGAWILDRIAPVQRSNTNVQVNTYIEERTALLNN